MQASEQISDFSRHILKIASSLDRTEVSRALVQTACELTGAEFGAVSVLDSHGDTIQFIQQACRAGQK